MTSKDVCCPKCGCWLARCTGTGSGTLEVRCRRCKLMACYDAEAGTTKARTLPTQTARKDAAASA